ncbi:GyrI-like domain-containing protein [Tolumonas lignilytica]|uniref:GyrI-like domain-containing protein n=1 Tax=Tolumonas lignilytica TaxID=1283284 RepID=UPI0004662783|nr:GyrI-like domain-containing protein [Tolumonas lignilytica]
MDVTIIQRAAQQIAYIRMVGPYAEVIGPGFERLMAWSNRRQLQGEWLALYWDNPDLTPPTELKTDVALTVPEGTEVEGDVHLQIIPAGEFAVRRCRVEQDDFETPWRGFFTDLAQSDYQFGEGACFERYFNNGKVDGYWDIEMAIPVIRK